MVAVLTTYQSYRRWFLLILLAGFALRVLWALIVPVHPLSDSTVYDQLAWNIATRSAYVWDNGDITAYWPVGTAFIYSIPFRVFGHELEPLAAVNVFAGTLSLALIMALARRWTSSRAALAAGAIYAVWPSQIEFGSVLASELLFNLFLLLSLWATVVARVRSTILRGMLAGVFMAIASYIRPTALPLVLLLAAALIWSRKTRWPAIFRFGILVVATMTVLIAPWTLRNVRELGTPALISTNGPPNAWMGNNPNSTGAYMPFPDDVNGMNEVDRSRVLGGRTREFVLGHPAHAASLFFRKLVITHDRETVGVSWNEGALGPILGNQGMFIAKGISTTYWLLMLVLGVTGVAGLWLKEHWRALLHPALLGWAYFAFVHAATVGGDRYHFPSIPFISILAGLASVEIFGACRKVLQTPRQGLRQIHRLGDSSCVRS